MFSKPSPARLLQYRPQRRSLAPNLRAPGSRWPSRAMPGKWAAGTRSFRGRCPRAGEAPRRVRRRVSTRGCGGRREARNPAGCQAQFAKRITCAGGCHERGEALARAGAGSPGNFPAKGWRPSSSGSSDRPLKAGIFCQVRKNRDAGDFVLPASDGTFTLASLPAQLVSGRSRFRAPRPARPSLPPRGTAPRQPPQAHP